MKKLIDLIIQRNECEDHYKLGSINIEILSHINKNETLIKIYDELIDYMTKLKNERRTDTSAQIEKDITLILLKQ